MDRSDLRERNYRYRETLSKLFIDIAKIVLTGVVIGGMSPIFTGSSVGVNYYSDSHRHYDFCNVCMAWLSNLKTVK